MSRFSTQLIIDCDETAEGFEIAVRFGPEDLEYAATYGEFGPIFQQDIGRVVSRALYAEREEARQRQAVS